MPYADLPEPESPAPAAPRSRKMPVATFLGGAAVALVGVIAAISTDNDEFSVLILIGMMMMIGGGIWGGVQLLGRIARSLGFR
jgi:hypothetical protein